MGLIEKIKLLFRFRQPATDLINEVQQVKAGYKTLPFWVTIIGTLGSFVAAAQGLIPATAALVTGTVLTALYNILRGATKADAPGVKPIFQTSEFWMGVLNEISNAFMALKTGGINPQWLVTAQTVIAAAMAAGQNLAGQSPNAPPAPPSTPA